MDTGHGAWEFRTQEEALLALAGNVTYEAYWSDRMQRADQLRSQCNIKQHYRAFEIGSGDGTVARLLAGDCYSIDCNDVSESFLAEARRTCADRPNVYFHKIGTSYLDYLPSEAYDFGYSLNVFIHLNAYDIFHYLSDVQRLLKDGGLFYFDAATIGKQTMALFREHAGLYKEDPGRVRGLLNFNHPQEIQAIIEELGLKVTGKSLTETNGWLRFLVQK